MVKEKTQIRSVEKKGTLTEGVKDFFKIIWRNKMSRVGLIIVSAFILIAIFGPIIVPAPKSDFLVRLKPPSAAHWLGTDYAGRDIFAMFINGTRTVLMVALYAGIFAIIIACAVGITSGLLGGKVDAVLMMITDIVLTMPQFPVIMVLGLVPIDGTHWGMMLQMAISQTSLLYGGLQPIVNFMTPVMGILLFQLGCYLFAMGLDEAMNPRLRR